LCRGCRRSMPRAYLRPWRAVHPSSCPPCIRPFLHHPMAAVRQHPAKVLLRHEDVFHVAGPMGSSLGQWLHISLHSSSRKYRFATRWTKSQSASGNLIDVTVLHSRGASPLLSNPMRQPGAAIPAQQHRRHIQYVGPTHPALSLRGLHDDHQERQRPQRCLELHQYHAICILCADVQRSQDGAVRQHARCLRHRVVLFCKPTSGPVLPTGTTWAWSAVVIARHRNTVIPTPASVFMSYLSDSVVVVIFVLVSFTCLYSLGRPAGLSSSGRPLCCSDVAVVYRLSCYAALPFGDRRPRLVFLMSPCHSA